MANEASDRISNLPRPILGDILSYFSTKEAVRSSVLSKKWKQVWTCVPIIDINDSLLLSKNRTESETLKLNRCFEEFVNRVLSLHKVSLQKFSLCCRENYDGLSSFREWMNNVTILDVKVFFLQYLGQTRIELPPSLFTCKKLVNLKLYNQLVLKVPQSAFFPCLKSLRLFHVRYSDEKSMKNLIGGCPALEELDMDWYYDIYGKTLQIQSSSVKRFRLEIDESDSVDNYRFVLNAKNLEQIALTDYVTQQFYLVSSSASVVSVSLDIHQESIVIELLRKMYRTKYLNLAFNTMQILEVAPLNNLPQFCYLTHLVLINQPATLVHTSAPHQQDK